MILKNLIKKIFQALKALFIKRKPERSKTTTINIQNTYHIHE